jgi:hypothetical protein
VPVVWAVRAGVFLPTTRSLRKWTSLDVLKGNNWDLEGRDKALLLVVPDGVIPSGASVLFELNVLAPQDDMGRQIGPIWDAHFSRNAICLTKIEENPSWSVIEFRTDNRSTAPVMQLLAVLEEQSGSG